MPAHVVPNESAKTPRGVLQVNKLKHVWGARTLVMGIINVTPDSFSGDGVLDCDNAVEQARQQLMHGADIIDVGGESTRPGHQPVSAQTEMERVVPLVAAIRDQLPDAVISLDTTKEAVLEAAKGVHILNSIWGALDELILIAAKTGLPIVIMHNKEKPFYDRPVMDEVISYMEHHAKRAQDAGLESKNIILDPGIGFGKLAEHNLQVLNQLHRLVELGFPTLIGTSRKSFIGKITGRPVQDRLMGSTATVALAVAAGIDIVRVHDVAATKDVVDISDAVIRGVRPKGWVADG